MARNILTKAPDRGIGGARAATLAVVLLFLSGSVAGGHDHHEAFYVAAVVEHAATFLPPTINGSSTPSPPPTRAQALAVMQTNLKAYAAHAAAAAAQGAQILVFPEDGLTGFLNCKRAQMRPYLEWVPPLPAAGLPRVVPCGNAKLAASPVLQAMSCLAARNRMVLVFDMGSYVPCSPATDPRCPRDANQYQYNTQVALDEAGAIVGLFHKYHLFYEPQYDAPALPMVSTFDTSFGVRFGMMVCFGIMFADPSEDLAALGVRDVAFSSWWVNTPPTVWSTQYYQAWSRHYGASLLAAGGVMDPANTFSGSGVFSRGEALGAFYNTATAAGGARDRLIVARVPKSAAKGKAPGSASDTAAAAAAATAAAAAAAAAGTRAPRAPAAAAAAETAAAAGPAALQRLVERVSGQSWPGSDLAAESTTPRGRASAPADSGAPGSSAAGARPGRGRGRGLRELHCNASNTRSAGHGVPAASLAATAGGGALLARVPRVREGDFDGGAGAPSAWLESAPAPGASAPLVRWAPYGHWGLQTFTATPGSTGLVSAGSGNITCSAAYAVSAAPATGVRAGAGAGAGAGASFYGVLAFDGTFHGMYSEQFCSLIVCASLLDCAQVSTAARTRFRGFTLSGRFSAGVTPFALAGGDGGALWPANATLFHPAGPQGGTSVLESAAAGPLGLDRALLSAGLLGLRLRRLGA